jgi:hypothetical protein
MKAKDKTSAARLAAARKIIAKNKDAKEILTRAFTNKPTNKPASKKPSTAPAKRTFTRAQIAKMSPAEYRRNRSAIFEAQRNNLIK